jgi:hypothetical protein
MPFLSSEKTDSYVCLAIKSIYKTKREDSSKKSQNATPAKEISQSPQIKVTLPEDNITDNANT